MVVVFEQDDDERWVLINVSTMELLLELLLDKESEDKLKLVAVEERQVSQVSADMKPGLGPAGDDMATWPGMWDVGERRLNIGIGR